MTVIEELIALLLGATAVTDQAGRRVFPVSLPQGRTLPAATIYQVSSQPMYDDDGASGLTEDRYTVDCWGATYTAAKTLAAAVKATLSAYAGTPPGGSIALAFITLEDERDDRESGGDAESYPFRTSLDFIVTSQQ